MNTQEIHKELVSHFPDVSFKFCEGRFSETPPKKEDPWHAGDSFIVVPADKIVAVCETLKLVERFAFDCLSDETAIDRKESFEVAYHLFSYRHNHDVVLKVELPHDDSPTIATLEGIWPVANWYEREIYDLFGINFEGHSDLRRIMLPDDWVGHPLRKDYKEEEDYHGIGTTRTSLLQ